MPRPAGGLAQMMMEAVAPELNDCKAPVRISAVSTRKALAVDLRLG